jgi:addiction module HigA family antidote
MKKKTTNPSEILRKDFMRPLKITAYRLAKETGMPLTRIASILKDRRRITVNTALKLGQYFGNTPEFWLGLQNAHEIKKHKKIINEDLRKIRPVKQQEKIAK